MPKKLALMIFSTATLGMTIMIRVTSVLSQMPPDPYPDPYPDPSPDPCDVDPGSCQDFCDINPDRCLYSTK